MKIAIAQIAPVLLDRSATLERVVQQIHAAGQAGAQLVVFGESFVPAYPLWLCRVDGARFECDEVKELHALYLDQSVSMAAGHLEPVQSAAREAGCAVVLGVTERADDRGGHSMYCSRVMLDQRGELLSVHRKLMPTYEERLAWGIGDGAGLVVHRVGDFTVSALNCWENWMPLARAALYAQGSNLHIAIWPGCLRLTEDITRYIAKESRAYVVSASGIIGAKDVPADVPLRERMCGDEDLFYDGGSCIANPDGSWLVEPVVGHEELITAELDLQQVYAARQSFDPVGHYARPDVLQLFVDQERQTTLHQGHC